MCPSRSNAIHARSADRSADIQVPSDVVKSMSRVFPRGCVTSQVPRAPAPASPCGVPPAWAASAGGAAIASASTTQRAPTFEGAMDMIMARSLSLSGTPVAAAHADKLRRDPATRECGPVD
jgi:hypothetical protein